MIESEQTLSGHSDQMSQDSLETSENRTQKTIKTLGWVAFGVVCLLLFTILKLPDDRIKSLVDAQISSELAQRGITYTANETSVSIIFGLSYKMKGITLNFPPPTPPVKIEMIKVSPSLIGFILKKLSGKVTIENAGGNLDASFSVKGSQVSLSFDADKMDLGRLGVFPMLSGIQGSAILDGKGSIEGDMNVPSTLDGSVSVNATKLAIESQPLMGFPIPKLNIAETVVNLEIHKGKATIKTFRIGKAGSTADDVRGEITGDLGLTKQWASSTVNLKIHFSLSDVILKSLVIVDALLGAGKQPDGSYGFSISGPLSAPMPTPITAGG